MIDVYMLPHIRRDMPVRILAGAEDILASSDTSLDDSKYCRSLYGAAVTMVTLFLEVLGTMWQKCPQEVLQGDLASPQGP